MSRDIKDLVRDIVASPLGDVIASVGEGVAEAQQALDEGSLAKTLEIYSEGGEEALSVLREIGYRPTFYVLPETTGEVRVSLHLGKSAQGTGTAVKTQLSRVGLNIGAIKPRLYATPVDAGYANRYGFQADVSAKLTFKIVPVPAPDGIDELRIVPDFIGKTIIESQTIAKSVGLEIIVHNTDGSLIDNPDENANITKQAPLPEKYARTGDEVVLTVE